MSAELLEKRRNIQRQIFALNDVIREAQIQYGIESGTDDRHGRPIPAVVELFAHRSRLHAEMPTLAECELNPLAR